MKNFRLLHLLLTMVGICIICHCSSQHTLKEEVNVSRIPEEFSGGIFTSFVSNSNAFDVPPTLLTDLQIILFNTGNAQFNRKWLPAGNAAVAGLGPTFNETSCRGCHVRDGRARPPSRLQSPMRGLLIRVSKINNSRPLQFNHSPIPLENYGGQIQDQTIRTDPTFNTHFVPPEAHITIMQQEIQGTYADGTTYTLKKPVYSFRWNFGEPENYTFSPRIAQQTYGMGLLSAIPEEIILNFMRRQAEGSNGISGKPNYVTDRRNSSQRILGRFGWKASQGKLRQQIETAFFEDMGLSNSLFANRENKGFQNCPTIQVNCSASHIQNTETGIDVNDDITSSVLDYLRLLSVPGRRNIRDQNVQQGRKLFTDFGCADCHITERIDIGEYPGFPEYSNQSIYPYTDLLLHDMGPGLADENFTEFLANGSEWRTPPLWGIGLIQQVNGHNFLLHDGRADGFEEAILWHGGEAEQSKEAFRNAKKKDRDAIVAFLNSL